MKHYSMVFQKAEILKCLLPTVLGVHTLEKVLAVGMAEKAKEFAATGGEIYHDNLPEGASHEH